MVLGSLGVPVGEKEIGFLPCPKSIADGLKTNVKGKTIKLLEDNVEAYLYDLGF